MDNELASCDANSLLLPRLIPYDDMLRVYRRVEKNFRESAARILKQKAIPIFATINPMSIQTWNKHRLQVHRTSHLNYFHQYQKMQDTIEQQH